MMDMDVAMCAYHTARIILHMHHRNRYSSPEKTEDVYSKVDLYGEIVRRIFHNSPVTAVLVSTLFS